MTLPVAFRRAARRDVEDAVLWYEERRVGLGTQFQDQVDAAVLLAAEHPLRFPQKYKQIRSVRIRRLSLFGLLHPRGVANRRVGCISRASQPGEVAVPSLRSAAAIRGNVRVRPRAAR